MISIPLSEDILIRELILTDQAFVHSLMAEIYPQHYAHLWPDGGVKYVDDHYGPSAYSKDISEERSQYWGIYYQDDIIGILKINQDCPLTEYSLDRGVQLQRIYLHPKYIGNGLGTMIMNWLLEGCSESSDYVWLEVMDTQEPAIAFYKRFGFQLWKRKMYDDTRMFPQFRGMFIMIRERTLSRTNC